MLFKNISLIDNEMTARGGMYVGVADGVIKYIGSERPTEDFGEEYDGKNRLLMSGLVNAHAHSPMGLLRGYAENLPLDRWLNDSVFPFENGMERQPESFYWGTMLGIAEMISTGTTSASDMYFLGRRMIEAYVETGMKCNLCMAVVGDDLEASRNYKDNVWLYENYNGYDNGRILIDFSVHAEYTSNERLVREAAEKYARFSPVVHIHLSETAAENQGCVERHGVTPAEYFDRCGMLENKVLAAHCVHLSDNDRAIMAAKGVSVASCPVSNLKLASGVMEVRPLLDAGINVALGTDGAASNNNLDLFEEIKLFATLHKGVTGDPTLVSPAQALYAGTKAGYAAQGRQGGLAVGMPADLIVLDLDDPRFHPTHDLLSNVVYSASGSDVVLTMVDGRVLYRDGEFLTLDIERVKYEADRLAASIGLDVAKAR